VTRDDQGNKRPFNFRICFLDPYQGRLIAYFAAKRLNATRAAVLYDVASDYSQGLREFFISSFLEYGGTIVADEGHRGEDVDFRAQLTTARDANPDVLIFPTMGRVTPLKVLQAREMGLNMPIVGGDGYGDFFWEITGDALNNSYWVSHVDRDDPALATFFQAYYDFSGDECKEFMNAIMAYDCFFWLKDAIERAGSIDPIAIRDALCATEGLQLTHAVITMDEFHNPKDKDGVILRAENGRAVLHERIRPD
jgi:branched-chain amino acid transport system substrate-binding protein